LLLDEPTNHLDFSSIQWLEGLLKDFKGSVLFITHDRSFLDNVATRIIELDRGKLTSYPGNFTTYQTRKEEQLEIEEIENAKFDKFLAQEEIWIRKGVKARRVRDEGRVKRLENLRLQRSARREQQGQVKLDVSAGERSGKIVAELENVNKSFGDKVIVRDFSTILMRGDKIGLIGQNGAGKTTLLKLILAEDQPDSGTVKQGSKLQIAYFDQMRAQLNDEASLADTIAPGSDWVEINGQRKHVMSYLSDFLFAPERARSPVKSLSGGERNRLLLARLFAKPANVLVLDEPTNDLDIDTLELLEELLEDYEGTVFLVSHDRTFLDNVVTQVIVAEGEGKWGEYVGGYSDWERYRNAQAANKPAVKVEPKPDNKSVAPAAAKGKKLSYKEQRELEELPKQIAALEAEQKAITERLNDADLYKSKPDEVKTLNARFAEIDELMLVALEKWEEIEAKANSAV
jgi:ATP-binding cassette subfamily F protein uup